ncbi:hypothetical protein BJ912DRAFT_1058520 [Pholiota molesta]|nr:hypothetical protein BJ912DRAFT_1058520 [Pholiota molesta]
MDRVTSLRSLPTSGQDADLVDSLQNIDSNRNLHDAPPSRPSSRLGFNRPILSTCPPDVPADSEAAQWSRSLFQNVGIAELRLSSIKQHPTTKMDVSIPACAPPPLESAESTELNSSSDEDEAGKTGSATTAENEATTPIIPRKSPSVSRLCFPFVTTSSTRRKKAPPIPPPTRHKYSCFPSLMSPVPAGRPFPKHPRHSYREHGYSRTALQHVKWFWSIREDSWQGSNTRSLDVNAYEGISEDHAPVASPVPQPPPTVVEVYSCPQPVNTIPYILGVATFPLYAIPTVPISTVVSLDCQYGRSTKHSGCTICIWRPECEDSKAFSEDSDATLVESENEADPPNSFELSKAIVARSKVNVNFEESQAGTRSNGPLVLNKASWSRSMSTVAKGQRPRNLDPIKPPWPTNWYRRWELLVDLSRRGNHHREYLPEVHGSPTDIMPSLTNASGQYLIVKHHPPDQDNDPTWDARLEIAQSAQK